MSSTPQEPQGGAEPIYAGMPGWVKWFLIAAVLIVALVVVALLTGAEHGPGRHMSNDPVVSNGSSMLVAAVAALA